MCPLHSDGDLDDGSDPDWDEEFGDEGYDGGYDDGGHVDDDGGWN